MTRNVGSYFKWADESAVHQTMNQLMSDSRFKLCP
jgi:hypothetical protein